MGHHHREEPKNDIQPTGVLLKAEHPFLAANDLNCLSIILPFLSESGKQLISFFINFGNSNPVNNLADPFNLFKQLAPKMENSAFKELLPKLLTLLSNSENKTSLNPAVLTSLLANLSGKKEEEE